MRFCVPCVLAICVTAIFSGCRPQLQIASEDHPWETYTLGMNSAQFEYPRGLKRKIKSDDPFAFLLIDPGDKFAILVVWGAETTDEDYPLDMIDSSIDAKDRIGSPQPIEIGSARGLFQDHRFLDQYSYRRGQTIVLVSNDNRLIFDVSYLESYEDQLQPIFATVLASLRFDGNK